MTETRPRPPINAALSAYGAESAGAMDAEHQVQTGLVRALCDAIRCGADAAQTREILDQAVEYSAVHFLSEQLLMRLCSYPNYDDHVLDHDHMMDALRKVAIRQGGLDGSEALNEAQDIMSFLARHIAARDRRFTEYYLDWTRRAADPATSAPDIAP
jgi:hemerythrin